MLTFKFGGNKFVIETYNCIIVPSSDSEDFHVDSLVFCDVLNTREIEYFWRELVTIHIYSQCCFRTGLQRNATICCNEPHLQRKLYM